MRKLAYTALIIFGTLLLLFSCKGKQMRSVESNNTANEVVEEPASEINDGEGTEIELRATAPQPMDVELFRENLTSQSADFSHVQLRLINNLLKLDNSSAKALVDSKDVLKGYFKNVAAKQCDSLYIAYSIYANLLLSHIVNDTYYSQVAEGYFDVYNRFDELPSVYQPIMAELNSYGIQLEDIGEGYADLSFYPDYFYEIFKPYTTEATKEYLRLIAFERAHEFLFDAAICITWEELAGRIINFEEYLDKYPQSMFVGDMQSRYSGYTRLLLVGCDNTPTCEIQQDGTRKLNADVYNAYQKIIDTHKNKRLAKTLKEYCCLFEENDMLWNDEADDFLAENELFF